MSHQGLGLVIFGASGMVGGNALRAALADSSVARVISIVRKPSLQVHPKLRELIALSWHDFSDLAAEFSDIDGCLFCLGVSSAGMSETAYRQITYDVTLAAATCLAKQNPQMTFVYVSGAGTDSSGVGRSMWARVKGQTENALLALPMKAAYMLRPGAIEPTHGIHSKTKSYRVLYAMLGFLLPVFRRLFPDHVLSNDQVSACMLQLVKVGYPKRILETRDMNRITPR